MAERYRIRLKDEDIDLSKMDFWDKRKLSWDTKDPDLLRQLSKDKDKEIRIAVASNSYTPVEVLRELSRDTNEGVRMYLAKNTNTPVDILEKLSKDKNEYVRKFVASNSNCPIKILKYLADDRESGGTQRQVLLNPNCTEELLRYMFRKYYNSLDVRSTLAYYADEIKTPKDILEQLAEDEDKDIRKEAQKRLGIYKKPSIKGNLAEEIRNPYSSDLPEKIVYIRGSYDLPVKVHLLGNVDKAYKTLKNSTYGFGNPNGAFTDVYIQEALNPKDKDIDCYVGYYGAEGFEEDDIYEELLDKNQYRKATSRVRKIANDEGEKIAWFAGTWDDPWSEALGGYQIDSPKEFEK